MSKPYSSRVTLIKRLIALSWAVIVITIALSLTHWSLTLQLVLHLFLFVVACAILGYFLWIRHEQRHDHL